MCIPQIPKLSGKIQNIGGRFHIKSSMLKMFLKQQTFTWYTKIEKIAGNTKYYVNSAHFLKKIFTETDTKDTYGKRNFTNHKFDQNTILKHVHFEKEEKYPMLLI